MTGSHMLHSSDYIHLGLYTCLFACLYTWLYTCLRTCLYTCLYACVVHVVFARACVRARACRCVHARVHVHTKKYECI